MFEIVIQFDLEHVSPSAELKKKNIGQIQAQTGSYNFLIFKSVTDRMSLLFVSNWLLCKNMDLH